MPAADLDLLVDQLLQPLPGDQPAGRWLRYEHVWMALSKSREEDDPALPLGEWERPLVKANWKQVAADCARLLREDSKDFQIAAWLCDAWIRVYQMDGLHAGLALLAGLAERFWQDAWPAIEDGDADRRIAPFVWVNTTLPLTLRLHTVLLAPDSQREQPLTMLDWERASTREEVKPASKPDHNTALSRQAIRASVRPADGTRLRELSRQAAACANILRVLTGKLDTELAHEESPSVSRLLATVDDIGRAADSLLQEIPAPVIETAPAPIAELAPAPASPSASPIAPAATPASASPAAGFSDRQHAYQVLAAAASYLESIEPHSPAPYMVRRAVQLGQLSLPEMLRQVTVDAGSLDKFFSLLGITPPR